MSDSDSARQNARESSVLPVTVTVTVVRGDAAAAGSPGVLRVRMGPYLVTPKPERGLRGRAPLFAERGRPLPAG